MCSSRYRDGSSSGEFAAAFDSIHGKALLQQSETWVLGYLLEVGKPEWDTLKQHKGFCERWALVLLKRPKALPAELVQAVYDDKALRANYQITFALLCARALPPALAMNLVHLLRPFDLLKVLRQSHLAGGVKRKIELVLLERYPQLATGQKIALARQAPRNMIRHLRTMPERPAIEALLNNYFFTYDDALFMSSFPRMSASSLEALAHCPRWNHFKPIKLALLRHHNTPNNAVVGLLKGLNTYDFKQLLKTPNLPRYRKLLIERQTGTRSTTGRKPPKWGR